MSFIIFNKHSCSNPLAISLLLSPNEYYSYEAYQHYATVVGSGGGGLVVVAVVMLVVLWIKVEVGGNGGRSGGFVDHG